MKLESGTLSQYIRDHIQIKNDTYLFQNVRDTEVEIANKTIAGLEWGQVDLDIHVYQLDEEGVSDEMMTSGTHELYSLLMYHLHIRQ